MNLICSETAVVRHHRVLGEPRVHEPVLTVARRGYVHGLVQSHSVADRRIRLSISDEALCSFCSKTYSV